MRLTLKEALLTSVRRISLPQGDLLKGITASDDGFVGFGEAYFSYIHHKTIKAWRLHKQHTANLIVPMGRVKVVLYKETAPGIVSEGYPKKIILSEDAEYYQRLSLPPGIWYGFQGLGEPTNLIFSFLNGEHSQDEQGKKMLNEIPYEWDQEYD